MKPPSIWTPSLEELLRQLVAERLSFSEIGRQMGLTKDQAIGKAHRMGLTAFVPKPRKDGPRKTFTRTPGKGCQFIAGEPNWTKRGERIYCNAPRKPCAAFCCEHHAIVWVPEQPRRAKAA